jgi:hypothetical protein
MQTLTLSAVKTVISRVEGVCRDSAKVAALVNEAESRLLNRPDKPVGSSVMVRFCIGTSNCLTWPRQVSTIEAYAVCSTPGVIRPPYFQFIGWPNGPGILGPNSFPGNSLIDAGTACTFDQVRSNSTDTRRISAVASNVADVGKKITVRYIDSNGQRVYTSIDGVVQEGEQLTLVAPPGVANTARNVASGSPYHVVKEVTQYPVYLYEVDSTGGLPYPVTKMLAQYEPSEELPIYRKSNIPGLTQQGACEGAEDNDCTENKQLTALVKLQHVPVVVDNDPLVIGNLAALKLMVMAILREEQNRLDESAIFESKARAEIDGELSSYLGDGLTTTIRMEKDFGAGQPAVMAGFYW